jgi:long-subunit acyl-CoA synthetase (AMP-forming)
VVELAYHYTPAGIAKAKKERNTGGLMETQTESHYKYEKYVPEYYNITSKLIDETVAKGFGDKVLVYYKDQTYTYKEMQSMINRVGNALYMLGVHMEEKVMLVMYDSPEAMASFYGAIKSARCRCR